MEQEEGYTMIMILKEETFKNVCVCFGMEKEQDKNVLTFTIHTVKTSEEGKNADLKKEIGPGIFFFLSFFNERCEGREETKEKETDTLKTNIKMIYE